MLRCAPDAYPILNGKGARIRADRDVVRGRMQTVVYVRPMNLLYHACPPSRCVATPGKPPELSAAR
jgi:hypothetical protein